MNGALLRLLLLVVLYLVLGRNIECLAIALQNRASRRAVLDGVGVCLAQQVILKPHDALAADETSTRTSSSSNPSSTSPSNRPLIPGTQVPYRPTGEGLDWTPPTPLTTSLANSRIGAKELYPLSPKLVPFADQELYYPRWMFGSWNVTATLKRKIFPYGTEVVPSRSLVEGSPRNREEAVGSSRVTYELHYYSTLANSLQNKVTVNLGLGVPQSRIILDRAFSARSISQAYQQVATVQDVEWDPRKDSTRITLYYGVGPLTADMRPLGERRTEIYITARDSESNDDQTVYCTSERSRIVQLSQGNVVVSDTESTTEYTFVDDNLITVVSRIAVYLTPNPNSREGVLWQQVGGKAVAIYDYEMQMVRNLETFVGENGKEVTKACVLTPKDVIQCN